jgi:hypothetical protein
VTTAYILPVTPSTNQTFNAILGNPGIIYNMALTWRNCPASIANPGWFLDIYDAYGNALVIGLGLVTGAQLLEQYAYLNLGFLLYVQSEGDTFALPTFPSLGSTCQIYVVY